MRENSSIYLTWNYVSPESTAIPKISTVATTIVAETTEQTTTVATTEQAAAIATTTVTENPQPATTKMKMNTGDYVVFLSLKFCSNKLSISLPGSIKIFSSEVQNRLSEFSNNMAWWWCLRRLICPDVSQNLYFDILCIFRCCDQNCSLQSYKKYWCSTARSAQVSAHSQK